MNLKHILSFVICALALTVVKPAVAQQQQSSHYQAAVELAEAIQKNGYDTMIGNMIDVQSKSVPPDQQQVFKAAMTEFIGKYLSWETMKDIYAKVYLSQFTEPELRDIIAFYKSPTGMKMIARTPSIIQLAMAAGQKIGMDHQDDLVAIMKRYMDKKPD